MKTFKRLRLEDKLEIEFYDKSKKEILVKKLQLTSEGIKINSTIWKSAHCKEEKYDAFIPEIHFNKSECTAFSGEDLLITRINIKIL